MLSKMNGPTIILYKPQIPPNTGNISRLCVGLKASLVLIKPAFNVDEASVKRAGLDHWSELQLQVFGTMKECYQSFSQKRWLAITKEGKHNLFDFSFDADDLLVFGNETMGLPPRAISGCDQSVRIPMWGEVRSLNLANAVSVVSYEYMRQLHREPEFPPEALKKRTYYQKKET